MYSSNLALCFPTDDICDYFGVKIAMYFAWLGFYTTSMLYPAVIGFVLWMLTESDQVRIASFASNHFRIIQAGNSKASACFLRFCYRFRRAATSVAWCLHSSTWCGPLCSWSGGRGEELSWRTSGEPWTRRLNPWRNRGLSFGFERIKLRLFPSIFLPPSPSHPRSVVSCPSAGCEALQSHNGMRGVLLSSVAEASIQVAGQSARLYPLHLLCLPGHAHLLRAAGQSVVSLFFHASRLCTV